MMETNLLAQPPKSPIRRPRLGFAGVGWIGRNRLEAIARKGDAEIIGVFDPMIDNASGIAGCAEGTMIARDFLELISMDVDAVVIATPSALHAEQAIAALEAGKAVFCQRPLARTSRETRAVVDVARARNRLLGVDLSYRFTQGMRLIHELIASGELGEIYAVEMKFHNAYGPDKPWPYDLRQAGGGCMLDLGIHLVDLALWCLGDPGVSAACGQLLSRGTPWTLQSETVEDYASAQIRTSRGAAVQLACSWRAPAGCEAQIEALFLGTRGGALFSNVGGSFYDFRAERFYPDRSRQVLAQPPEDWAGGAALDWVRRLALSRRYDAAIEHIVTVHETLDAIYGGQQ